MSIRAAIHHLTHYKYDRPVSLGPQIIRLRPAPHSRTRVISHSLKVTPADHFVNHQQDPYGNWLARYVFPELVNELKIEVDVVADMTVYNPFDFFVEESAEIWPFEYGEDLRPDLVIYRTPEPVGPRARGFLEPDRSNAQAHRRFRGRSQQPPFARDQVSHPDGAGGAKPGRDIRARVRLVPRFELASGPDPAQPGLRRPVRVRLSHPAQARPCLPRRAARHRPRFHRPPRVGRGLSSGRRLDRARPHLRPADGGKPYSARRDAALSQRRADFGPGEFRQRRFQLRNAGQTGRRASAHHQALFGRGLESARRSRRGGRQEAGRRRRPAHHGRRADLRLDRRFRIGRVEHRRRRPDQARARRPPHSAPARPLRAGRVPALRAGQMVSGRVPAALDVLALLAPRRQADLAKPKEHRGRGCRNRGYEREGADAARRDRLRARRRLRLRRAGLRRPGRVDRERGEPAAERLAGELQAQGP